MYVNVTSANEHQTVQHFATAVIRACLTQFVNAQQAETNVYMFNFAVEKSAQSNLSQRKYINIHIYIYVSLIT
jgi:hypothetical protein